ncbi:DUF3325 family protein [Xanthomonas graminis]|uniref:DUF3325 family protein n=1 Tax=Xanthomonas graminis TaxID=3390026 RepID=UPI0039648353
MGAALFGLLPVLNALWSYTGRSGGWLLLAAAFACCVTALGWSIGPVLWLGTLSASAALLTYGLLPYRPRAIVPLALAAPPLGLAAALLC